MVLVRAIRILFTQLVPSIRASVTRQTRCLRASRMVLEWPTHGACMLHVLLCAVCVDDACRAIVWRGLGVRTRLEWRLAAPSARHLRFMHARLALESRLHRAPCVRHAPLSRASCTYQHAAASQESSASFALHSRAMSDARALRAWRVQGARAMHARRVNRACVMRGWRGRVAAAQCIASLVGARPFSDARTTRAWQLVTLPMVGPASIVA